MIAGEPLDLALIEMQLSDVDGRPVAPDTVRMYQPQSVTGM